jgi:hypothetical protein
MSCILKRTYLKNIFNMMMDVKGKSKDNMKAMMDIPLVCHHKNIELVYFRS